MKKYISSVLAVALVSTFMVGCSDSNDSDDSGQADVGFNGVFVDNPMNGVSFACIGVDGNALQGVTADGGIFGTCQTGATVAFSIGNLSLGTATQTDDNIFQPQDIAGDQEDINKVASLLLSLSTTTGDNVRTVTQEALDALESTVTNALTIADLSQDVLDTTIISPVVTAANAAGGDLVIFTAEEAESHLVETEELIESGLITPPTQPTPPATTGSTGQ